MAAPNNDDPIGDGLANEKIGMFMDYACGKLEPKVREALARVFPRMFISPT